MATYYANEFVGQKDGTHWPPYRLDGRIIGAKERRIRATKPTATAFNPGDQLYVGTLPQGAFMRGFTGCFDTSFGSTTISVGPLTNPTKYVNAKTLTVTDQPVAIGPRAAAITGDTTTMDEDIYVTFGAAALATGITGSFETTYTISA